jgi:glutathione S-transferase
MKLYCCPGACSLVDYIALQETGLPFESESIDLKTKITAWGADFNAVTSKGDVPALVLDNGELLIENLVVLGYVTAVTPKTPANPSPANQP